MVLKPVVMALSAVCVGALLFAVTSDVPIASVLFTDAAGEDFAIANVRYASQFFVPVPRTGILAATGLLLMLLQRRRAELEKRGRSDI